MSKKVWVFSGQGSQYYQMGHELYQSNPTFRKNLDKCDQHTRAAIKTGFMEELFKKENTSGKPFTDIRFTNAALFSIQYSLAQVFLGKNIIPDCVTGFSL